MNSALRLFAADVDKAARRDSWGARLYLPRQRDLQVCIFFARSGGVTIDSEVLHYVD